MRTAPLWLAGLAGLALTVGSDVAHWASSAAEYTESEEGMLYTPIPDSGNPPANPLDYPIVQVIEFEITPGGEGAVLNGIRAFKEAVDASGANALYGWSRVASGDGPPAVFVAVWADSFAALGAPGPTPLDIIASHHGTAQAVSFSEAFAAATIQRASRIWTYRQDLSDVPN